MKKKICIITSSYPQQKYQHGTARDFALLLARKKIDVSVLAMQRGKGQIHEEGITVEFFPWIGTSDQPLDVLNPKNPLNLFKILSIIFSGIFSTINFMKRNKNDYCIALWAIPSGFFAMMAKFFLKTPYSIWALGSDIWDIDKIPFGRFILKKVLKNADKLYADGLQLAKDVEKISKRNCEFLPTNRFFNTTLKPIKYSKFDSSKTNFIFLGRYHVHKGVDLLIKAINELTEEEKTKTLFHIFGMPGPEEKTIRKMIKELNLESNTFVNNAIPSDEVYTYISNSDFVVIPSRIESIPVVFSNGIESDKPVIVTDVGDMGDLVRKYNVGFITIPDVESIVSSLREALKADKRLLESFKDGRRKLKDYLSMERSVDVFIKSLN